MKINLKNYYMRLTPVDIMTGTLSIIMIFLIALRGERSPSTAILYILKYSLVFIAAVIIAPASDRVKNRIIQNPVIQFARNAYPMFLLAPVFQWSYPISKLYFTTPFDEYLLRADTAMFGFNISRDLAQAWGNQYWLTEWFNFSYLSYYWVTLYLPLYLYFQKRLREYYYVAFISGSTIFACFIFHSVFPAQGPVHFAPETSGYLTAGPVSAFARFFLTRADIPGGAMPSGHIAGAVAILFLAWRFERRAFWLTAPVVISLCIATVYCRYHYAVDGIAGIIVAVIGVYFIGPKLYEQLFPHFMKENEEGYEDISVTV